MQSNDIRGVSLIKGVLIMKKCVIVLMVVIGVFCLVGCGNNISDNASVNVKSSSDLPDTWGGLMDVDAILRMNVPDSFVDDGTVENADGSIIEHYWRKKNKENSALLHLTLLGHNGKAVRDANGVPMGLDGSVSRYLAVFEEDYGKADKTVKLENIDATAYVFEDETDDGKINNISCVFQYDDYIVGCYMVVGVDTPIEGEEVVYHLTDKDVKDYYNILSAIESVN